MKTPNNPKNEISKPTLQPKKNQEESVNVELTYDDNYLFAIYDKLDNTQQESLRLSYIEKNYTKFLDNNNDISIKISSTSDHDTISAKITDSKGKTVAISNEGNIEYNTQKLDNYDSKAVLQPNGNDRKQILTGENAKHIEKLGIHLGNDPKTKSKDSSVNDIITAKNKAGIEFDTLYTTQKPKPVKNLKPSLNNNYKNKLKKLTPNNF